MGTLLRPPPGEAAQDIISLLQGPSTPRGDVKVEGVKADNLQQYVYEICWAALQKEISVTKLGVALKASGASAEACGQTLATVFWLLWMEVSSEAALRTRLIRCVEETLKEGLVDKATLLETEETELLEEAGLIGSKAEWEAKEAKLQDSELFPENWRLLFCEEIAGFSELTSWLHAAGLNGGSSAAEDLVSQMAELIGTFQLEPDRVLASILDAYEQHPGCPAYRDLLASFSPESVSQLLGFKLQSYHQAGSPETPESLLALAADLVKGGILPLVDVFAHLSPTNEELAERYSGVWAALVAEADKIGVINLAAKTADPAQKVNTGNNPLDLDARDLDGDGIQSLAFRNQKVQLLAHFVRLRDTENMRCVLSLMKPTEVDPGLFPDVCEALCQVLGEQLSEVFAPVGPGPFSRKALKAPLPEEVFENLRLLGIWVFRDAALLSRLIRAFMESLQGSVQDGCNGGDTEMMAAPSEELATKIAAALEHSIAPAVSLFPANPAMTSELWDLVCKLPYTRRFKIYSGIKNLISSHPLIKAAAKKATVEAKRILRRLHVPQDRAEKKKKLKPFGRTLGKILHAIPVPVFDTIVSQIESFGCNSIGEPLLDSLRYLTPMSFDVMTFVILDRLTMQPLKRRKIKDDGINLSDWLLNLAQLAGEACKRFPGIDMTALCQYVTNQLKQQEGADLQVLREIIAHVTGIVTVEDLNEAQVEALAGGDALRHEAITMAETKGNRRMLSRGAKRLLDSIQQGPSEEQVLMPLMVLIAQQRNLTITNSPYGMPLKGIGELYDRCQQTFYQYVEFLQTSVPDPHQYAKLLPPMEAMHSDYRLDPEAVFALWRPALQLLSDQEGAAAAVAEAQKDEEMEEGEAPAPESTAGSGGVDGGKEGAVVTRAQVTAAVLPMLPAIAWDAITPELYTTFWGYSLSDIYNPSEKYKSEEARLKALLRQKESQLQEHTRHMQYLSHRERERSPTDDVTVLKKEKKNTEETIDRLQDEGKKQAKRVQEVHAWLDKEKGTWLMNAGKDEKGSVFIFIQHCIVPRVMFSPSDALYCCKFAALMTKMDVPFFSSLVFYDKCVKLLVNRVICITDREAENLGVFLRETLGLLERWRSSKEVYDSECASQASFRVKLLDPSSRKAGFKEFQQLTGRWQKSLTKTFAGALSSKEYTQIRATLLVLVKVVKIPFPAIKSQGRILLGAAKNVVEHEEREDLKTLANSYCLMLEQQIKKMPEDEAYGGIIKKAAATAPKPSPAATTAAADAGKPGATEEAGATKTGDVVGNVPGGEVSAAKVKQEQHDTMEEGEATDSGAPRVAKRQRTERDGKDRDKEKEKKDRGRDREKKVLSSEPKEKKDKDREKEKKASGRDKDRGEAASAEMKESSSLDKDGTASKRKRVDPPPQVKVEEGEDPQPPSKRLSKHKSIEFSPRAAQEAKKTSRR